MPTRVDHDPCGVSLPRHPRSGAWDQSPQVRVRGACAAADPRHEAWDDGRWGLRRWVNVRAGWGKALRPAALAAADQDPGDEHQGAAESDLECC